jgi:hypothetical protein
MSQFAARAPPVSAATGLDIMPDDLAGIAWHPALRHVNHFLITICGTSLQLLLRRDYPFPSQDPVRHIYAAHTAKV